jgi:succinate dehydrogenase/fumarate reductase flavoprotein subunit
LATGGFANDRTPESLLNQYAPHLAHLATTNGPWATGDGVKLGMKIGALLVDLDQVCGASSMVYGFFFIYIANCSGASPSYWFCEPQRSRKLG